MLVALLQSAGAVGGIQLVDDLDDRNFAEVIVGQVQALDPLVVVQEHLNQALFSKLKLLLDGTVHDSLRRQAAAIKDQVF